MPEPGGCVYLIGGTTEAHRAARRLQDEGYSVVVSVATPQGAECSARARSAPADIGRKDAGQIAVRAGDLQARAIVDCSHPYAVAASGEARAAADGSGIPYLRFSRPALPVPPETARAASWEEAAAMLGRRPGRALLTIGSRNLEPFVRQGIDFTARILPVPESIGYCHRIGIDARNIIAAHPPFSTDFNRACIRQARADVIVSKESGQEGGQDQKLEAARLEGIEMLLVQRPAEPGAIHDLDELVLALRGALS